MHKNVYDSFTSPGRIVPSGALKRSSTTLSPAPLRARVAMGMIVLRDLGLRPCLPDAVDQIGQ